MLPKKRMKMAAQERGEPVIFEGTEAQESLNRFINFHQAICKRCTSVDENKFERFHNFEGIDENDVSFRSQIYG